MSTLIYFAILAIVIVIVAVCIDRKQRRNPERDYTDDFDR